MIPKSGIMYCINDMTPSFCEAAYTIDLCFNLSLEIPKFWICGVTRHESMNPFTGLATHAVLRSTSDCSVRLILRRGAPYDCRKNLNNQQSHDPTAAS